MADLSTLPDAIKKLFLTLPFGKNLPPPSGGAEALQNPANIIGRALGGTVRDVIPRFPTPGMERIQRGAGVTGDVLKNILSGATGLDMTQQPKVNLGQAFAQQTQPQQETIPAPIPTATPQLDTKEVKKKGFKIPKEILQMLPQLIATGVGTFNKGALPMASGFSTGYGNQIEQLRKEKVEKEKLGIKNEQEKWDDAYKTALALSKTGPMGGIQEMTPQQLDTLAQQVYEIKYGVKKAGQDVSTNKESSTVQVQDKQGNQFELPRNQLEDAQKQGYTLING